MLWCCTRSSLLFGTACQVSRADLLTGQQQHSNTDAVTADMLGPSLTDSHCVPSVLHGHVAVTVFPVFYGQSLSSHCFVLTVILFSVFRMDNRCVRSVLY